MVMLAGNAHWLQQVEGLDLRLVRACNGWCRIPGVCRYFSWVSRLGNGVFWYGLMLVLPGVYGEQGGWISLRMALAGLMGLVLYRWLKQRTARPRPYVRCRGVRARLAPLDRYSFPSGHTLHATAFTLVLALALPHWLWWVLPFTVSVALSRLVLGLHYASDVLAGALLGAAMGGVAGLL